MVDYIDFMRYLQNVSSKLPKTAGNKANNAIRRMQELTKTNNKNNVINTPKDVFKPKANNASEDILDALYGKDKITPNGAKETIRKNININKNKQYRFPTKEVTNKLNTVKNVETTQKALKAANTVGTGALATLNFFTGLVDRYEANQLYQQAIMEPDPNRRRELQREAFRKNLSGSLAAGLGVGSLALKGLGKGAIYGGKAISKLAKPMGKEIASELVERGANPKTVDFLRRLEIAKRSTGRGLQGFGNTVDKYSNYLFNPITQMVGVPLLKGVSHGAEWIGNMFYDDNDGSNKVPPTTPPAKQPDNTNNKVSTDVGGYGGYGGGYSGGGYNPNVLLDGDNTDVGATNDAIKTTGDGTTTDPNGNKITEQQPEGGSNIIPNAYDVLDEWRKKQEFYDAYRNSLINYRKNYGNLYEQTYARNKALEGMKDFGNPSAGTYTSSMSPLDLASNEVALDKTIADEMVKPYDEYREMIGNAALAKQMGLPTESMYTNNKLLDSFTDYKRAMAVADMNNTTKLEVAKQKNALKEYELYLKNEQKKAELQGDWAKANLIADSRVKVASIMSNGRVYGDIINTAPWYPDTQTLMETLEALGYPLPRQQQQTQQVQPMNKQTVRANASIQATPRNKQDDLGAAFGRYSGR